MTAAKKKTAPKPLPCPFCGCKPKVMRVYMGVELKWCVACHAHRCVAFCETHNRDDRAEALAAWNRRAK